MNAAKSKAAPDDNEASGMQVSALSVVALSVTASIELEPGFVETKEQEN